MLLQQPPNIPNVIPQVGFGEGGVYTDLTPYFGKAKRMFPEDPQLK